jgi:glycine dehydrogenase
MASMYAVYHGPQGLTQIALNVHRRANARDRRRARRLDARQWRHVLAVMDSGHRPAGVLDDALGKVYRRLMEAP